MKPIIILSSLIALSGACDDRSALLGRNSGERADSLPEPAPTPPPGSRAPDASRPDPIAVTARSPAPDAQADAPPSSPAPSNGDCGGYLSGQIVRIDDPCATTCACSNGKIECQYRQDCQPGLPCVLEGMTYLSGETMPGGKLCERCVCQNGNRECKFIGGCHPGPVPVPDPGPQPCGRGHPACPTGQYCAISAAKSLLCTDVTGQCKPRLCYGEAREACCSDSVVDPVCGCDGVPYNNACEAAFYRVGYSQKGRCPAPPASCATDFPLDGKNDPAFDKSCTGDSDCVAVTYQHSCCGTTTRAVGIRASEKTRFEESKEACRRHFYCSPLLGCPGSIDIDVEDGSTARGVQDIGAACRQGRCTAFVKN